jgi:quercetin dioxygenase-like cupin family protein
MKLNDLHISDKAISTLQLFKATEGNIIALKILKNEQLKEHSTKTPALLVCIDGSAMFENENHKKEILLTGDYIIIEANVKHWINAKMDSNLLLIK